MVLWKALELLVEDWRAREQTGSVPEDLGTKEVLNLAFKGGMAASCYNPLMTKEQLRNMIEFDLIEAEFLDSAIRKAEAFKSPEELLATSNLHDFFRLM